MSTPYQINLTFTNPADVDALQQDGYYLCGLKAVNASTTSGNPVVWFSTGTYANDNVIAWNESYGVYSGTTFPVEGGVQISASNSYSTSLDALWEILSDQNGQLTASTPAPTNGSVEVWNNPTQVAGAKAWMVGLSEIMPDSTTLQPICAFSLPPNMTIEIQPIEKVMLYFATTLYNNGTVISESVSPGLLIDLTESNSAAVSYTIDGAWSANVGSQFTQVPANQVASSMINLDANLQASVEKANEARRRR